MFDTYVIQYVRNNADQRLWAVDIPLFLAKFSMYSAIWDFLTRGQRELHSLKDEDTVPRDNSMWVVSDITAYMEAKVEVDLVLQVLPVGYIVSNRMQQNHDPVCAALHQQ